MKATFVPLVLATVAAANPIKIVEEITQSIGWHKKGGEDKDRKGSWGASGPFTFTSTYNVIATPGQVVDSNNTFTGGLEGAIGYYRYGINSWENVICYNITLVNFQGEYQSPALTATHIHQAQKGRAGPPRIALPNPDPVEGTSNIRRSIGCLYGPFVTGVNTTGVDSGAGFVVSQIEENPADFFTDVHSSLAVPGAVRGQLSDSEDEDCEEEEKKKI
ncbi:hypothetical protein CH063_09486 [Colletotrichum higginsianum]|uniref:CHRD domain-containing protein n=2 Tax=Colletotrichum higginsianum TaxID=80884 RepID=H1VDT3_COLHI|nr:hypothetical protein CH63R_03928 [Colletotrichum higginsianum IMI 349063]OBR11632.1 hypothetical protein CH63R_03928 [Colletotrichum higginsianum IMI 349063]TIC99344.1 hypothetical protein CH35J_006190 [Colletotrichum higginsianum]GJC93293.1 hypothetical protein ColKHC_02119 [Colletotrichum higginsianum]CCF38386.1 hypothetical protein CH063_09486 [Colletotrichum higginsianum]